MNKSLSTKEKFFAILGLLLFVFGAWMGIKTSMIRHLNPQNNIVADGVGFLLNDRGRHYLSLSYIGYLVIEYALFFGGAWIIHSVFRSKE